MLPQKTSLGYQPSIDFHFFEEYGVVIVNASHSPEFFDAESIAETVFNFFADTKFPLGEFREVLINIHSTYPEELIDADFRITGDKDFRRQGDAIVFLKKLKDGTTIESGRINLYLPYIENNKLGFFYVLFHESDHVLWGFENEGVFDFTLPLEERPHEIRAEKTATEYTLSMLFESGALWAERDTKNYKIIFDPSVVLKHIQNVLDLSNSYCRKYFKPSK